MKLFSAKKKNWQTVTLKCQWPAEMTASFPLSLDQRIFSQPACLTEHQCDRTMLKRNRKILPKTSSKKGLFLNKKYIPKTSEKGSLFLFLKMFSVNPSWNIVTLAINDQSLCSPLEGKFVECKMGKLRPVGSHCRAYVKIRWNYIEAISSCACYFNPCNTVPVAALNPNSLFQQASLKSQVSSFFVEVQNVERLTVQIQIVDLKICREYYFP
jgi:hypothetical protein